MVGLMIRAAEDAAARSHALARGAWKRIFKGHPRPGDHELVMAEFRRANAAGEFAALASKTK